MNALDHAKELVGTRETKGKNRSPIIDEWNKWAGVPLGSPYCAVGISLCFFRADGTGKPFTKTAGSQAVKRWGKGKGRYFTDPQRLAKCKGALFGWTNDDGIHGHVGFVVGRLTDIGTGKVLGIKTVEFNSNSSGSRDGEGVVENERDVPRDRGHRLWFVDTTGLKGGNWWE